MRKHTLEFVQQCFKDGGCELLEKEYVNSQTKMKYICICGDISKITFGNFQQGGRCMKCAIENRANKRRYSFEYIEQCFKDHGCKLLEKEYINNHTKMKYECSCGNISIITFKSFTQGHRCNKCGIQRQIEKQS